MTEMLVQGYEIFPIKKVPLMASKRSVEKKLKKIGDLPICSSKKTLTFYC